MTPDDFDASRYKVLCVDDEPNILSSLRRMLSFEGFEVITADSGAAALAHLAQEPVDVIISDMQMPHMNGTTLLNTVHAQWPHTMRLLLTGNADLTEAAEAVQQGRIYRYIGKPWCDEELLDTIQSALAFADAQKKG